MHTPIRSLPLSSLSPPYFPTTHTTMDANNPGGFDLSALSSVLNDPR